MKISGFLPFLFFISLLNSSVGQELVLNGGHEVFSGKLQNGNNPPTSDTCRRELFGVGVTPPPFNFPNPPFIASAGATPDHRCDMPNTGIAHGGMFLYGKLEYPQYQLCKPLQTGNKYRVTYFIKLQSGSSYAIDQIGCWFTQWGYAASGNGIKATPHHITPKGEFFQNENAYTKVTFDFVADTDASAIIIGNFLTPTAPSGSEAIKIATGTSGLCYYFIDDISVQPLSEPTLTVGKTKGCNTYTSKMAILNYETCNKKIEWYVQGSTTPFSNADSVEVTINQPITFEVLIDGVKKSQFFDVYYEKDFTLGKDTTLCNHQNYTLSLPLVLGANYQWSDQTKSNSIQVDKSGTYSVTTTFDGCVTSDTIQVILLSDNVEKAMEFPNAFTPNGDNTNDTFYPVMRTVAQKYELSIYNRFGKKIFTSTDSSKGWDGKVEAELSPSEVYIWVCRADLDLCGKAVSSTQKGEVLLIR